MDKAMAVKLIFVVLASAGFGESAENGKCFDFPSLDPNLTVTVKENDTITIPFQLRQPSQCFDDKHESKSIYISRTGKTEVCILRVEQDGDCRVVFDDKYCQCPGNGDPNFRLTVTVTEDDGGYWTWKAGHDTSHWTQVLIDLQPKDDVNRRQNLRRKPQGRSRTSIAKSAEKEEEPPKVTSRPVPTTDNLEAETGREHRNVKAEDTTVASDETIGVKKEEGPEVPESSDGLATFGAVFVGVNVVTVIAVATIVYVLRGRRERKRMRNPESALPPTPKQQAGKRLATRPRLSVTRESATNSYMELPSRPESSQYERISALIGGQPNDGYEIATVKNRQQVTLSGYEIPTSV